MTMKWREEDEKDITINNVTPHITYIRCPRRHTTDNIIIILLCCLPGYVGIVGYVVVTMMFIAPPLSANDTS